MNPDENGYIEHKRAIIGYIYSCAQIPINEVWDIIREYGKYRELISTKSPTICRFIRHSKEEWEEFKRWLEIAKKLKPLQTTKVTYETNGRKLAEIKLLQSVMIDANWLEKQLVKMINEEIEKCSDEKDDDPAYLQRTDARISILKHVLDKVRKKAIFELTGKKEKPG